MSLKKYHAKRNFEQTSEPFGKAKKSHKHLIFVVQKHAASHLHYDLRLEMSGVLKSWAVPKGPSLDPTVKRLAIEVEDHPFSYRNFEGIIPPKQYGAGTVMLWDKGEYELIDESPKKAYEKGELIFTLKGEKLKGIWKLIRIKNQPPQWLLIKAKDTYAHSIEDFDITTAETKSVLTDRTMEEIAANFSKHSNSKQSKAITSKKKPKKIKMPIVIRPQLATLVNKAPEGNEWLHEIKFDGYRLICFIKQKTIKLMTRNQQDWTKKFPTLVEEIKKLPITQAILDGEIVALDDNSQSNFQLLQNSIHQKNTSTLIYYVFDLLYCDHHDLSDLPLIKRKAKLNQLIPSKKDQSIQFSDYIIGNGEAIYKKACQFHLEGIMSKALNSPYIQKRTRNWLKVKCVKQQEFIIGGFTQPNGQRKYFGSLLLGAYAADKKLHYCGHVGTGFTQESLKMIWQLLKKYQTPTNPFVNSPKLISTSWVKPRIVVEVAFSEWTQKGLLRHSSFKGLRHDKPPKAILIERI